MGDGNTSKLVVTILRVQRGIAVTAPHDGTLMWLYCYLERVRPHAPSWSGCLEASQCDHASKAPGPTTDRARFSTRKAPMESGEHPNALRFQTGVICLSGWGMI